MANTDIYSFTPLSTAFTAPIFRKFILTSLWTSFVPNFIQIERNVGGGGGRNHLHSYMKNGFHGTNFYETQLLNGMKWRVFDTKSHLNRS
jgi:hypothetical protein